jgi:hypothetical protein
MMTTLPLGLELFPLILPKPRNRLSLMAMQLWNTMSESTLKNRKTIPTLRIMCQKLGINGADEIKELLLISLGPESHV